LSDLLLPGRIQVEKFALNATNVTPQSGMAVPNFGTEKIGNRIRLNFGANGIGDDPATDAADGFYRILVDLNGDGDFVDTEDSVFGFHRIFGDANGNGTAAFDDADLVLSQLGMTGENLEGDMDGRNGVDFDDYFYALDQAVVGHELIQALKDLRND
jgi:hypothetical protein